MSGEPDMPVSIAAEHELVVGVGSSEFTLGRQMGVFDMQCLF